MVEVELLSFAPAVLLFLFLFCVPKHALVFKNRPRSPLIRRARVRRCIMSTVWLDHNGTRTEVRTAGCPTTCTLVGNIERIDYAHMGFGILQGPHWR